jgi:hypothetical protein
VTGERSATRQRWPPYWTRVTQRAIRFARPTNDQRRESTMEQRPSGQ